jgi:L-alanine-DL-glutamate epimerase-like enolase superfamily enzyme
MKLQLSYQFYNLPLRDPFTISRYTVTVQKTVVVRISDGETTGYGEATANPYYHSTAEKLAASLEKGRPVIESSAIIPPEALWPKLHTALEGDYFALCAIDVAYWDFYARKMGRTQRSLWPAAAIATPLTSYTIGIASVEEMKHKIVSRPWPIYKIKLGTPDDLEIVTELRQVTNAIFRVDANCAWTVPQTIEYSKLFKNLNVEFIEQPLPAGDFEGMRRVKAESGLPIIADESCQREEDVLACCEVFDGINIKLMKCGGITPALRMIVFAQRKNILLMAGCMTESTVGISALVQLAPFLDYIDADGPLLLATDIATGAAFANGEIVFSENVGTGVKMIAD